MGCILSSCVVLRDVGACCAFPEGESSPNNVESRDEGCDYYAVLRRVRRAETCSVWFRVAECELQSIVSKVSVALFCFVVFRYAEYWSHFSFLSPDS